MVSCIRWYNDKGKEEVVSKTKTIQKPNDSSTSNPEEGAVPAKKRFVTKTSQETEDLANLRTSKGTKRVTTWEVNAIKGTRTYTIIV